MNSFPRYPLVNVALILGYWFHQLGNLHYRLNGLFMQFLARKTQHKYSECDDSAYSSNAKYGECLDGTEVLPGEYDERNFVASSLYDRRANLYPWKLSYGKKVRPPMTPISFTTEKGMERIVTIAIPNLQNIALTRIAILIWTTDAQIHTVQIEVFNIIGYIGPEFARLRT